MRGETVTGTATPGIVSEAFASGSSRYMPGSYREDLEGDSGEDRRIEELRKEVEALRIQWAEIRIAQLEDQRRMLRGQLAVIGYLRTQRGPWTRTGFWPRSTSGTAWS